MSEGHHIIPVRIYALTLTALLVLTGLTIWTAENIDLGSGNIILAMIIATTKATLVCTFFMGLKYDRKLNILVFVSGIFFLSFLFMLTFMDIQTRDEIDPIRNRPPEQQYLDFQ